MAANNFPPNALDKEQAGIPLLSRIFDYEKGIPLPLVLRFFLILALLKPNLKLLLVYWCHIYSVLICSLNNLLDLLRILECCMS